ncbi:MAG: hypothetical protein R2800_04805 [Flavipsychrobacter sp.]
MKRAYIVLDGCFTGTGVRDINTQEWIEISDLVVSDNLKTSLENWATEYQKYTPGSSLEIDDNTLKRLDDEGLRLSNAIMTENEDYKIDYYDSKYGGRIYIKY